MKALELLTSKSEIIGDFNLPSDGILFEGAKAEILQSARHRIAKILLADKILRRISDFITVIPSQFDGDNRWIMPTEVIELGSSFDATLLPDFAKYLSPKAQGAAITYASHTSFSEFHTHPIYEANMVIHKPIAPLEGPLLRGVTTVINSKLSPDYPHLYETLSPKGCTAIGLYPDEALLFGNIPHAALSAKRTGLADINKNLFGADNTAYLVNIFSDQE